jgi:RHS repeat-associated protein
MKSINLSGTGCSTSGTCLIYDALGRLVEEDTGSTHIEIWQTQVGRVAFMEGSVEEYSLWPTPSGSASQTDSGYLHKDWLGSARLGSSISASTIVFDQAYAPYGDIYAKHGNPNFSCCSGSETTFGDNTQDVATGIYNTPNRELGNQGRWFSPDPAQSGWNPYAYATDPNSMIDPTGLSDCGGREACGGPGGPGDPGPGYDILGSDDGTGNDDLASSFTWADFWGGDAAASRRLVGGFLVNSDSVLLPGRQCAETTGDYVCWNTVAWNPASYGGRAANNITSTFRLITKSDYCRGGDRTIQYWLVDTSTGGMPSSNWWVTEHIQSPVPTNSGGTNNTPNQYLDWLSNGGTPYNALQSFTVSQGSGAPSYPVYLTIGGQDYGTLGLWMSNNPLRNGQPSPNSVNCPPQ